jgi:hypothetical protein
MQPGDRACGVLPCDVAQRERDGADDIVRDDEVYRGGLREQPEHVVEVGRFDVEIERGAVANAGRAEIAIGERRARRCDEERDHDYLHGSMVPQFWLVRWIANRSRGTLSN